MIPWSKITFLGDSVVMLPAAAAIIVWLVAGRAWRMAFWWGLLFTTGLALVAITKIAFIGWGIGISALDFTGISGHAMRAAAVLPVIGWLTLQRSAVPARMFGVTLGLALGGLVMISRVALDYHSVSEGVAGFLLGTAISLGFIRVSAGLTKPRLNRWLLAFTLLGLFPTSYAEPAPTNQWVHAVALYLSGHDCPYVRGSTRFAEPAPPKACRT
ncbi:MAG: rane-associated phospholipid phosphatase [Herminiimonas sp.]|jgi:membrane-associated phospholipid phosphatase|nr:rane-associated phospholipid phosphatase [Herminiimonas sp.]